MDNQSNPMLAMLMPMVRQFMTPENIRGMAEWIGQRYYDRNIVLITTFDDMDDGTDYLPEDFMENLLKEIFAEIGE